ncbi:MAG: Uma2 family endonuclease [Cyanobacteria bacterium P01_D01_bin.14]
MTATLSQITFSEYLLLPYDGRRTELVNGKIIEMSEASPLHVDIIDFLMELLKAHILAEGLDLVVRAGTGIEIPRESGFNNARDPDLVVCQRQQWRAMRHLTKAVFLSGNAPSLAIEVVSPGNSTVDTVDKRQEYALAGVPEYWIVNPVDGYILVLLLDGDDYRELGEFRGDELIASKLLPRFSVSAEAALNP